MSVFNYLTVVLSRSDSSFSCGACFVDYSDYPSKMFPKYSCSFLAKTHVVKVENYLLKNDLFATLTQILLNVVSFNNAKLCGLFSGLTTKLMSPYFSKNAWTLRMAQTSPERCLLQLVAVR